MSASDWIQLVATLLTIVITIGGAVFASVKYLNRKTVSHAIADERLVSTLNKVDESVNELTKVTRHMDARLNQHDIDIALIKQAQVNQ